jgi:hypothetical protein
MHDAHRCARNLASLQKHRCHKGFLHRRRCITRNFRKNFSAYRARFSARGARLRNADAVQKYFAQDASHKPRQCRESIKIERISESDSRRALRSIVNFSQLP